MNVGYFYKKGKEFAWTGAPLQQVSLYDTVMSLKSLPHDHAKHAVGSIWFHTNDKVGVDYNPISEGIVGCDIDAISKEDCDKIMNSFEELALVFPCLVCCWYSHSYNDRNKSYGGLHLVIKTDKPELCYNEESGPYLYRNENIKYSAALAWYIYEVCGIDVRPVHKPALKKTAGIDTAMLSIGQQCFLNYSSVVKWNNNIFDVHISTDTITLLKKFFNGYNWFNAESDYKIVSCEVKKFNSDIVFSDSFTVNTDAFPDNQLGHNRRVAIENFLAGLGWKLDEIVEFVIKLCYGDDFRNGITALRKGVTQTSKVAIKKFSGKPSDYYTAKAQGILTALGVDIDIDIQRVYQPIDFKFNEIFEEVWESMRDDEHHNIHTNPSNWLRVNLNSDQYLTDYKFEITEMITKYEMTYLIADCMVGKTTYALNMQNEYGLFDDSFIVHFSGDTIDVCVPYNSVADNKTNSGRKDIKRVKTADLSKFSWEKRNVFIWNTVLPLYEKYFNMGIAKRLVLFFDESQKIVTDDYRWETVFELFKVLPGMYKHFVFMTGTPAGELEFLKQYFPDHCVIKVDKEIDYKRECKILKYKKFGVGDRIKIIEDAIADGRLPLIYSNSKNYEWREACKYINKCRIEEGLTPYKILDYSRPNADRLDVVNSSNSIKAYDIVIATKYCSVGIDFKKDDKRMRAAIIDYASEKDCTFHDIWQFTLRNRNQDTVTKLIVRDDESYGAKLYNYWYYVGLFDDMAKIHTYKMVKPTFETEEDQNTFLFAQDVFQIRKFGQLVSDKNNYFDDDRNVKLLSIYYLYRKIFSNINIIKHMLERRGVDIIELNMEHVLNDIDCLKKEDIYQWFVANYDTISNIYNNRKEFDAKSYQIDINSDDTEYVLEKRIYSRDMRYMDWLIGQFAGKPEWLPILQAYDCMTKDTFAAYNRMYRIAKRITKREIDKIKRLGKHMVETDLDDMVIEMIDKHYGKALDVNRDDIRKAILLRDVIDDYKKILRFAIDNIEFIEEIKNATDEGKRIEACHKMKIAMDQKEQERIRCAQRTGGKSRAKEITVRLLETGEIITFDSRQDAADYFNVSKQAFNKFVKSQIGHLKGTIEVIN